MGSDPWSFFEEQASNSLAWARSWKKRTGRKVIGHLLPDVPEELIHASGALPLALEGATVATTGRAQETLPGYTCSHALGLMEMGLAGELDFLDGLIIPYVCDTTRNLYHTWSNRFPDTPHYFLRLPKRLDHPGAMDYLRGELGRLAQFLGGITGKIPGDHDLEKSLVLYRKSRERLRRAYELHRENPRVWSFKRLFSLISSAMRIAREEHLIWMKSLPWEESTEGNGGGRVALYVRGRVWNPPAIVDLLDELGFTVVGDDMVVGSRSILDGKSHAGFGPLDEIVYRFFSLPLYPGYHREPRAALDDFLTRVRESKAKGVLFLNPKFCEAAWFDTPDFQKALEKEGIPSLVLEGSTRGVSIGQLRVRLEAFREILGGEIP